MAGIARNVRCFVASIIDETLFSHRGKILDLMLSI